MRASDGPESCAGSITSTGRGCHAAEVEGERPDYEVTHWNIRVSGFTMGLQPIQLNIVIAKYFSQSILFLTETKIFKKKFDLIFFRENQFTFYINYFVVKLLTISLVHI